VLLLNVFKLSQFHFNKHLNIYTTPLANNQKLVIRSRNLRVNSVDGSLVASLLLVAVIPDESGTLTGEGGWNPGVLVGDTPNGDTSALSGLHACGENVLVVGRLLTETGRANWS
jgi:hypothetical protein